LFGAVVLIQGIHHIIPKAAHFADRRVPRTSDAAQVPRVQRQALNFRPAAISGFTRRPQPGILNAGRLGEFFRFVLFAEFRPFRRPAAGSLRPAAPQHPRNRAVAHRML
jgi:hypothetical protein